MNDAHPTDPTATEGPSVRPLWEEAVGKIFKLSNKAYGVRTVTYTQMRAVRDTGAPGGFEVEVLCVEIIARILTGKRTHSSICKEGVLRPEAMGDLVPDSFGVECLPGEFDKVTSAILTHATATLDWVMNIESEEQSELEVSIDLPHFKVNDMEASLLRNSPFLVKDLYFLTANSIPAAFESIQQELKRASRNMRLTDAVDPVYVEKKNEAVASLHTKLKEAKLVPPAAARSSMHSCDPMGMVQSPPTFPLPIPRAPSAPMSAPTARRADPALELDSIALALLGKPAATRITWERPNPSEECAFYRVGQSGGPMEFVRWLHVSGRVVPDQEARGRKLQSYFTGFNNAYTGPDKDGIYPLLKPAT